MVNTQDTLVFSEFSEVLYNDESTSIVTVTYNVDNCMMNIVMEDTLIRTNEDNALHFENCNGTELIIKEDAFNRIINEGFDPLIERKVFRMELANRMVIHISFKDEIITTKQKGEYTYDTYYN